MRIQIVDNISRALVSVLSVSIEQSKDVRIAVAFVSRAGLAMVEPSIKAAIRGGAQFEFLIGLDTRATEPAAVQRLYDLSRSSRSLRLYCSAPLTSPGIYHPKLYLLRRDDLITSIIGSSNLTQGGLRSNVEVNVAIEANMKDELVSDIYDAYYRLRIQPKRLEPDGEFLALYAELCDRERRQGRKLGRDRSLRDLMTALDERGDALPAPPRPPLHGWLELVYDSLPDGEFSTHDVYAHEDRFQRRYPENRNIRPKVRQKLQDLRDLGFIEHLARARWRKV